MPRKRKPGVSYSDLPELDPDGNPDEALDLVRVRRALANIDKVAELPSEVREQLFRGLAAAVRIALGGLDAGKRHKSNRAMTRHVFMRDVGRVMKQAGLPVTDWQQHDGVGGESHYYQVAHALGRAFGLHLPKDLGPPAEWAAKITGEMSPIMKAEQSVLAAQLRQRLGNLTARLKAAQDADLAARRRLREVWGDHLVDPPRTCEELASAYLGFPF